MKTQKWKNVRNRGMTPARIAAADAETLREAVALRLRNLREAAGLTQEELAARADLSQSQLSRLEQETSNPELLSIFRYVLAAGADSVKVSVSFAGAEIPLAIMSMSEEERDLYFSRKYDKPAGKTLPGGKVHVR